MPLPRQAFFVVALAFVIVASSGTRSFANAAELLRVVTYNVAGLPEGISRSSPVANLPLTGEGLNRYDLALIQEDFAYPDDRAARREQLEQLARAIARQSEGRAVLVGGDFNLSRAELELFEKASGTRDACRALRCPEPNRIDRVLFRASTKLSLAPVAWRIDRRFLDAHGRPLSDHSAVAVTFRWKALRS